MSILTQRTAAVLNLAQIDQTLCADCNHPLKDHLPSMNGEQKFACKHNDFIPHPEGYKFGSGKFKECRCKSFSDPSERLDV